MDTVDDLLLHQYVLSPTRFRTGQNPSLLNLILTNFPYSVVGMVIKPPLGKSDHVVITCEMWIKSPELVQPSVLQRRFSALDQDLLMVLATATYWRALGHVHTVEKKWSPSKTTIHLLTGAVAPFDRRSGKASVNHGWQRGSESSTNCGIPPGRLTSRRKRMLLL